MAIDTVRLASHGGSSHRLYKAWSWGLARVSLDPTTEFGELWQGAIVSLKFAYHVLLRMGIEPENIHYRNLSNASTTRHPESNFTACVHDIAIGNLDFCFGDFWQTAKRIKMCVPFAPIYSENVILVVRSDGNQGGFNLLKELRTPFAPFSLELWVLIISVLVVSALGMAFFEHGKEGGDFSNKTCRRAGPYSMYLSMLSLCDGGMCFNPATTSGKIFGLGLAFFITITLASFTANTAAFLTFQAQPVERIKNLADALAQNSHICTQRPVFVNLASQYPALRRFYVQVEGNGATGAIAGLEKGKPVSRPEKFYVQVEGGGATGAMAGLGKGVCDAALVVESEIWENWGRGEGCQFHIVGDPLMSYLTGFYVHDGLNHDLQFAAAEKRLDGTWSELASFLQPLNTCPKLDTEEESGPEQLQASHMLGNCLILLLCFIFSLILFFVEEQAGSKIKSTIEKSRRRFSSSISEPEQTAVGATMSSAGHMEATDDDAADHAEADMEYIWPRGATWPTTLVSTPGE
eukprot:CAMPEP_0172784578 /NCGR_PEP_ID=MMETSP1074-20121228/205011_1 /TAXON_ID=2916 /ORGANISM="Ceratium fusus, Strain PA161109" /LENGTH=519 /DNA_ID=CAMNT_0013621581 /DNA_START=180 /DNA_END=1740 /DNA_ORIENTATION=+